MSISVWIYLAIWVLSYFTSRKAGLSDGKAALVASGITLGAKHFDVAGKIEGLFQGTSPGSGEAELPDLNPSDSNGGWLGGVGSVVKDAAGSLLPGLAAGAGGLAVGSSLANSKYFPWILLGVGYLAIKVVTS